MANGEVRGIFIARERRAPMEALQNVQAEQGNGLCGDRYQNGGGSYNQGRPGKRQVTLINAMFFEGSGFEPIESRRNLVVHGVELMDLIGKEFRVGNAVLKGVKYCDPCLVPSRVAGKSHSFREAFFDRGGLVAEVIKTGVIKVGSAVIPPKKDY